MNSCIYPGSFDVFTLGHLNIINRIHDKFDRVIVAVGNNATKNYTFSLSQRMLMIKELVPLGVEVLSFDGLLADFAFSQNVKTVIKGVRNSQDFDYERLLHEVGLTQQSGVDTHILISDRHLQHVSSSASKEICRHHGLLHDYVPYSVKEAMEYKLNGQVIIGITGMIGTGKSYVSDQLYHLFGHGTYGVNGTHTVSASVLNVDLDKVAHEMYNLPDSVYVELRNHIVSEFNLEKFDRKVLGEIVFSDPLKLRKLNSILRNPILTRIRATIKDFRGLVILNGALLIEADFSHLCNNNMIVVDRPVTNQMNSLRDRGLNPEQIKVRLGSQFNTTDKIKKLESEIRRTGHGKCLAYNNDSSNIDEVIRFARNLWNDTKQKNK